jgi:hypothetical protein
MTNNSFTGQNFFTRFIMPLFLVTVCPPFAMLAWHINVNLDGSFVALWQEITGFSYCH